MNTRLRLLAALISIAVAVFCVVESARQEAADKPPLGLADSY